MFSLSLDNGMFGHVKTVEEAQEIAKRNRATGTLSIRNEQGGATQVGHLDADGRYFARGEDGFVDTYDKQRETLRKYGIIR